MTPPLPRFYTIQEVADILRLPEEWDRERWVRQRCKDGRIKATCISRGVWRISEQALAEFMEPADAAPVESMEPKHEPVTSLFDGLSAGACRRRITGLGPQ